jgi:protein O-GlcNAc transferase
MNANVHFAASAYQQAVSLVRQGQLQRAEALCREILRAQPDHGDALLLCGVIERQTGRPTDGIASFRSSIAANPASAIAHTLLGDALLDSSLPQEALHSYERGLRIDPELIPALFGRGNALMDLGRAADALARYEELLRLQPDNPEVLLNRAGALLHLFRYEEALAAYERAVTLSPALPQVHIGRGNALYELRRFPEAELAYDEAGRLDSGNAAVAYHLGKLHLENGRALEALACFERALHRDADLAAALRLRADALQALQRPEEAAECLAELLKAQPDGEYAAGALLHAQQSCADWSIKTALASRESVIRAVRDGKRADSPFSFLSVADEPAAQLQCAQTFISHRCPPEPPLYTDARYRHERLRVAYVSPDFREHAVSYLFTGVVERHDRRRFETVGIALRPEEHGAFGGRVKRAFDHFIDVSGKSDRAVAELMRAFEIDIAVDLTGLTEGLRPQIFSHRPAPVQVQYLGYPGTMGASFIDYLLADTIVVPPGSAALYSEHIVYLPHCFQANDTQRKISAKAMARADTGLPHEGFVYCCFNNTYKLNPAMFDVWMRLLDQSPGSALWLLGMNHAARTNLRKEAAGRGVDPQRLVFADRAPYDEHLKRLGLADLFLDTLPFNAGATASDALWAGLPVLTCAGRSFAARMAGSLLHTAGLPELVTQNLQHYETMALNLAQQPEMLLTLRRRLQETRQASPLFDADLFRRHLETAYEEMWGRHDRGEAPASFTVQV